MISVAAELAGMHPQTLRIYERRGLVAPARTQGGNRRYSDADIERLRRIAELAGGMNLEGIRRVMELEAENDRLRTRAGRGVAGGRAGLGRGRATSPARRPRPPPPNRRRLRPTLRPPQALIHPSVCPADRVPSCGEAPQQALG